MNEPLDEWVDNNAKDLKKDIVCLLEELSDGYHYDETLPRYIMTVIRQWAENKK